MGLEKMCVPITEVDFMAVKKEELGLDLDRYTRPTKETHCIHPAIPVHIYQRRVVE